MKECKLVSKRFGSYMYQQFTILIFELSIFRPATTPSLITPVVGIAPHVMRPSFNPSPLTLIPHSDVNFQSLTTFLLDSPQLLSPCSTQALYQMNHFQPYRTLLPPYKPTLCTRNSAESQISMEVLTLLLFPFRAFSFTYVSSDLLFRRCIPGMFFNIVPNHTE